MNLSTYLKNRKAWAEVVCFVGEYGIANYYEGNWYPEELFRQTFPIDVSHIQTKVYKGLNPDRRTGTLSDN